MPSKKVSSTVDMEMFRLAQDMTGTGQAETIRRALEHFISNPPTARAAPIAAARVAPVAFAQEAGKRVTDMTDDEKSACLRLFLKSRRAIGDSLVYLAGEEAVADTATKKRLRILIGDMEADMAKIKARITAFQAEQLTMTPPSPEMVAKISQLAEEVGQLTLEAQRADQVIAAVKSVVEIWTATQV